MRNYLVVGLMVGLAACMPKTYNSGADQVTSGSPEARVARIKARGYPAAIEAAVISRRVMVGMYPDMVQEAWGKPHSVNTTVVESGRHEQWVWVDLTGVPARYVYFEKGVVTAIQTSR